jgi:hypothetical protein
MVSKAIAALDVWLARAEEVLQEQRAQCISPNLSWTVTSDEWTVTLAAFELGLPDLLESLCARPGRWILIAEDDECRHHFWQALAFEDGSLVTEVVSNRYLEGTSVGRQRTRLAWSNWAGTRRINPRGRTGYSWNQRTHRQWMR